MKKSLLLLTVLLLFFAGLIAQQPTGAITIFSEDGSKFFLVLNGQRQNVASQTNVRIDGLTQPYYSAKVIFEDQTLGEISKNLMVATGGQPDLMDVTYKLKKDKNGKEVLRYYSAVAMQPNYVAPPDVYVIHFGAPVAALPVGGETISHTTTTSTTTTGNPTSMNINLSGTNMNMSVNDPNMTTTTQTTTTHTTTTTTSGDPNLMMGNTASASSGANGCTGTWPMNSGNFSSALTTVKNQGFDETKLSTAKQIASSNCLDAAQIATICKEFGFEENKLQFAKFAYDHCTEPNNYFKINNVFAFSTSVDDLNKYIQSRH